MTAHQLALAKVLFDAADEAIRGGNLDPLRKAVRLWELDGLLEGLPEPEVAEDRQTP